MIKMQIALDEERVKGEGKYSLKKMWARIDLEFTHIKCVKEIMSDGSVTYSGSPSSSNHTVEFFRPYTALKKIKWFADFCTRWVLLDNDDDETLPFEEENILPKLKTAHDFTV